MPQRSLFADTFFWIALLFPRDAFHAAVVSFSRSLRSVRVVTSDEVLNEVLNHFAGLGPFWRSKTTALVHNLRNDPGVDVCRKPAPTSTPHLLYTKPDPTKGTV